MKVLLDTHALLWFIGGDPKLSGAARESIVDPANSKYVSAATPWEIAIKTSLGKFTPLGPLDILLTAQFRRNGFQLLPIEFSHSAAVSTLPFHHRDPFDRLLIAQAITEGMALVSVDSAFDMYGVQRLW
jgi:PIN domain nuclease of toxin-antitoxin system